jgi:hypothetical protein
MEKFWAKGMKEGRKEGREEGRKGGRKEGRKEGREEGRKGGRKEGRKEGREEGRRTKKVGSGDCVVFLTRCALWRVFDCDEPTCAAATGTREADRDRFSVKYVWPLRLVVRVSAWAWDKSLPVSLIRYLVGVSRLGVKGRMQKFPVLR